MLIDLVFLYHRYVVGGSSDHGLAQFNGAISALTVSLATGRVLAFKNLFQLLPEVTFGGETYPPTWSNSRKRRVVKQKVSAKREIDVCLYVVGDDAEKVQEQDQALQHRAEFVFSKRRRCDCDSQRAAVVNVNSYAVPAGW